jgi:transposase
MLDLGDAGDADSHRCGYVPLRAAGLLARLGELVAARLGQKRARASLDLVRRDSSRVQIVLQVPRKRRSFTAEFKAEIVELCQRGDRSVGQVARDFDLTETAVREWVRQAERDAGTRRDAGLTTDERAELAQLRRDNRRLRDDVEILKRATSVLPGTTPSCPPRRSVPPVRIY